jgi:hypothetical protein
MLKSPSYFNISRKIRRERKYFSLLEWGNNKEKKKLKQFRNLFRILLKSTVCMEAIQSITVKSGTNLSNWNLIL